MQPGRAFDCFLSFFVPDVAVNTYATYIVFHAFSTFSSLFVVFFFPGRNGLLCNEVHLSLSLYLHLPYWFSFLVYDVNVEVLARAAKESDLLLCVCVFSATFKEFIRL